MKLVLNKIIFGFIRILELPFYIISRTLKLSYQIIIPANTYAPWLKDKEFTSLYSGLRKNSLVNKYQAWELWTGTEMIDKINGDILEVGVWRGSTTIIMANKLKRIKSSKKIYACDTFQGVVKAGGAEDNYYKGGEHNDTSFEFVQKLVENNSLDNVELLKGVFPDETGKAIEGKTFSLCHIDVDAYLSAREILKWVWPRLSIGGMIVFNDYGFPLTKGITMLVNEQKELSDRLVLHNLNGNGILIKIKI